MVIPLADGTGCMSWASRWHCAPGSLDRISCGPMRSSGVRWGNSGKPIWNDAVMASSERVAPRRSAVVAALHGGAPPFSPVMQQHDLMFWQDMRSIRAIPVLAKTSPDTWCAGPERAASLERLLADLRQCLCAAVGD